MFCLTRLGHVLGKARVHKCALTVMQGYFCINIITYTSLLSDYEYSPAITLHVTRKNKLKAVDKEDC